MQGVKGLTKIQSMDVSRRYYTRLIKMLEEIIDMAEDEEISPLTASEKAAYILNNIEPNKDIDYGLYPETHLKNCQLVLDVLVEIRDNYTKYSIIEISNKAKEIMRKVGYEEEYE